MKRSKSRFILVILGIVFIGAAMLLYLHNSAEDKNAGIAAEDVVRELQMAIYKNVGIYH